MISGRTDDDALDPDLGTRWHGLRRFAQQRAAVVGAAVIVVLAVVAVLAPVLAPHDPDAQDLYNTLSGPGTDGHPLGTDKFGRDQLSRLLYGTRVSLIVSLASVSIAAVVGVTAGLLAGFVRGPLESVLARVNDALLALPAILFFIVVAAVFGRGLPSIFVGLGLYLSAGVFRVTQAATHSVAAETFIEAERAIGATRRRILVRHVLPNALSPVMVRLSVGAGVAVTAEATLSFLGLGVVPPTASWGTMLSSGFETIQDAPFLVYAPAAMIVVTVLSLTLIGDGLRHAFGTRSMSREAE